MKKELKKEFLIIRINGKMLEQLKLLAKENEQNISKFVRNVLREKIRLQYK